MNIVDKRGQTVWAVTPEIGDVFTWNDGNGSIYIRVEYNRHMNIETKKSYLKEEYILVLNITSNVLGYVLLEELKDVKILEHELVIK